MRDSLVAGSLALIMLGAQAEQYPRLEVAAQQGIPDAPKPQALAGLGSIAPGKGTTSTSAGDLPSSDGTAVPGGALPAGTPPFAPTEMEPADNQPPPLLPLAGEGVAAIETLRVRVNFVDVPFTVKDSKGRLVPGLTWREVRIYENGARQQPAVFTVDPYPLSVALVIDQSLSQDNMTRVNDSLGALPGAFAPYDTMAVFTYNNGPKMQTDFTGAQSARLVQAVEKSKTSGREALLAGSLGGPLAQTTVINDQNFDPNTAANRGHTSMQVNAPREVHTLNDAILAAATSLSRAGKGRRRVIYVISDGKEYGSEAKYKDVIRYLQTNNIGVYGTLVGDSSLPVVGFLDRIHLPLMMRDNILPLYAAATGGNFDAEFRTGGIERSFAKIAEEVRTQYTVGYYTREPFIDGKYRTVEVKVMRPNLTVLAKRGYYPSAMEAVRPSTLPSQP